MLDKIQWTCIIVVIFAGSVIFTYEESALHPGFASFVVAAFFTGIAVTLLIMLLQIWTD